MNVRIYNMNGYYKYNTLIVIEGKTANKLYFYIVENKVSNGFSKIYILLVISL